MRNPLWKKIAYIFVFLLAVFPLQASSCPAEVLALKCQCRIQLSGIQLDCSGIDFFRIIQTLSKAKLPLTSLKIRDENLRDIPNDAFTGLLIKELDISNNSHLRTIGSKTFSNLGKHLRIIKLANNSLSTLPRFEALRVLESLDLSGNQISLIPDGAFKGLNNLVQIRLKNNKICFLTNTAMTEIRDNLVLVDLNGNCLTRVPSFNFAHAKRLHHLDLSRNRIGPDLIAFSFHDLPQLREIRLDRNLIKRIAPQTFYQLPNLQNLSLKRNEIRSMEPHRFANLPKLELIDMSYNQLRRIANQAVYKLPNLRQLILSNNEIRLMEFEAISRSPRLQVISLSNNFLSDIQPQVLHDLPAVVLFLMANNSLHTLAPGMFDEMRNLQQLSLRNNSIERFHSTALSKLKYLSTIDLGSNKLQSLEPNSFDGQEKLFWLDLTSNQLTAIPDNIFPQKIDYILLAGNPLDCENDANVNWFVHYIRRNNVKTKAQNSDAETVCASPGRYAGVPLRELLLQKANESFQRELNDLVPGGFEAGGGNTDDVPLKKLFPPLSKLPVDLPGLTKPIPGLNTVVRATPQLSKTPGLSAITNPNAKSPGESDELISTLKDFTQPLTRFAAGEAPTANDLTSFFQTIPKLASQLPGVKTEVKTDYKSVNEADKIVEAFKLDPTILPETIPELPGIKLRTISGDMLRNFLLGKPIPGLALAREARERITRQLKRVVLEVDGALSGGGKSSNKLLLEDLPPIRRKNPNFDGKTFSLEDLNKDAVDPNKKDTSTIMFYSIIGLTVMGGLTLLTLAILCFKRRAKVYEESSLGTEGTDFIHDDDDMDDFILRGDDGGRRPAATMSIVSEQMANPLFYQQQQPIHHHQQHRRFTSGLELAVGGSSSFVGDRGSLMGSFISNNHLTTSGGGGGLGNDDSHLKSPSSNRHNDHQHRHQRATPPRPPLRTTTGVHNQQDSPVDLLRSSYSSNNRIGPGILTPPDLIESAAKIASAIRTTNGRGDSNDDHRNNINSIMIIPRNSHRLPPANKDNTNLERSSSKNQNRHHSSFLHHNQSAPIGVTSTPTSSRTSSRRWN